MLNKRKSIVIIITLYNSELIESESFMSLININDKQIIDYNLILYNNSKEIEIPNHESYLIINDKTNQKLAGAYNFALNYALKNNQEWILLVDQDTEITQDYFIKLASFLESDKQSNDIVAIVPFIKENSQVLSPHKINFFNCRRKVISNSGLQNDYVSAFNSMSLLKVNFITSIGGFNIDFPLDMLDYWYYYQIHKNGKKVYVLDTYVNHNLSITHYERNISLERHTDLLLAEKKFIREIGLVHFSFYKVRLLYRFIKQLIFFKNKRYAQIILKNLFNKL